MIKKFIARQIRKWKVLNINKFHIGDKFKYSWRYKAEFNDYDDEVHTVTGIHKYGNINGDSIQSGLLQLNAHWLKKVK